MICAMKIISVGFDLDAYVAKSEKEAAESEKKEEVEEKKRNGNLRNRARSNKRNNKKLAEAKEKTEDESLDLEEVASVPGWFEYAGTVQTSNH